MDEYTKALLIEAKDAEYLAERYLEKAAACRAEADRLLWEQVEARVIGPTRSLPAQQETFDDSG